MSIFNALRIKRKSNSSIKTSTTAPDLSKFTEWSETLVRWENVLKVNPTDTNAKIQILTAHMHLNHSEKVDQMIKALDSELADDQFVQLSIARIVHAQKHYETARIRWEALRREYSNLTEPLINLANIDIVEQKFDSALDLANRILELNPDELKAHLINARVHHHQEHWSKAIDCWKHILENDNSDNEAAIQYATALYKTEQFDELYHNLENSLNLHQNKPPFLLLKLRALMRTEDLDEALVVVEKLSETSSTDIEVLTHKSKILYRLDRLSESEKTCMLALEIYPNDIQLLTLYARIGQAKAAKLKSA